MLINHDGRVVLSDFGVTANLERAATSTRRFNSHVEASTSDAAGAHPSLPRPGSQPAIKSRPVCACV